MSSVPDRVPVPLAVPTRLASGSESDGVGALGQLIQQAERLLGLQRHVADVLPDVLRDHCTVVGLDRSHLRLLVSSSVRATQVRYLQNQILTRLGECTGEPVTKIQISVRTPRSTPIAPRDAKPAGLSAAAAAHLAQIAEDETDQGLRKALERLASRVR